MKRERLRDGDNYIVLGEIEYKQRNIPTGTEESESKLSAENGEPPRAVEK